VSDRMARWRCGLTRANRRTIAALIAASALLLALVSGDAQVSPSAAPPVAIEVRAEPITAFDVRDPSLRQFGLLEFRGGLVLRSSDQHFGGISAIRVAPDGAHFIALTDKGWWFRGRILYEGTRPSGIADAEMAPILGADGRPLAARGWSSGLAVRMRRIALGEIKPGAVVDGPVLFDVDLGYEIDNMEGLSVHRNAGGEVVLTLISDDNFSAVQRTLLLQFTLAEP